MLSNIFNINVDEIIALHKQAFKMAMKDAKTNNPMVLALMISQIN